MYQDLTGQSRIGRSRTWRLGVIGLAVALFASSIGVVAGGADPASAQATTKTRGVTATTIRVGGLRSLPNYAGSEIGAQVVFDKVNEAGGIAGRTFEYVTTVDDQNNNDANVAAAKKLVEDEKVFAVVPVISNFFAGASVLRKARVPYFGWGFHDAFCGHKEAFGFGGCGVAKVKDGRNPVWPGLVKKAHPKVKTMGFLVEDSDAAAGGTKAYLRALGGLGLKESFTEYGIPSHDSRCVGLCPEGNGCQTGCSPGRRGDWVGDPAHPGTEASRIQGRDQFARDLRPTYRRELPR